MIDWAITYTLDSAKPDEERMIHLEEEFDITVTAGIQPGRWYATVHVAARTTDQAFAAARKVLAGTAVDVASATAVTVETFAEYEQRAYAPTLPTLVGAAEVAELLHISRQRVHQLSSRPDFPLPLVTLRMGPLWDQGAIEKFDRSWSRSPGRPRRSLQAS